MAPQPFDSTRRGVPRERQSLDTVAGARSGTPRRHRVVLTAPRVGDVVRGAGGWLFDRVAAGWDVLVLTAEPGDPRPLHILGATALDLETAWALPRHGRRPHAVALSAETYGADARVRDWLHRALEAGLADARIWDCRAAARAEGAGPPMPYLPSGAARAFKAQALVAAALQAEQAAAPEVFHGIAAVRPLASV